MLPEVESVPDSFQDVEDYIARFEPLLVHECHAHLSKARDDIGPFPDNSLRIQLRKISMQRIDSFTFVTFEMLDDKAKMPRRHDILALSNGSPRASSGDEEGRIICMVDNLKPVARARTRKRGSKHRELRVKIFVQDNVTGRIVRNQLQQTSWVACNVMNVTTLEVCLPLQILNDLSPPGSLHSLTRAWPYSCVCPCVQREYLALYSVPDLVVCPLLLQPRNYRDVRCRSVDMTTVSGLIARSRSQHNRTQWKAIESAMGENRMVLLQGPPGTGKTKTITGIVSAFLDCTADESREPIKRPRVFVCAPSNAAADEIALRLMHDRRSGDIPNPEDSIPVVRIGDPHSVHGLVKPVHLEVLIERKLGGDAKLTATRDGDRELRQGQQEEHRKLNEDIGQLHVKREKLSATRDVSDYERLTAQLTQLHSRKDEVVNAMNASFGAERRARAMASELRLKTKLDVLNRAQVVCCTLSASGSETVGDGVRGADLIIIDEAAQATEVSTLIPLKHLMANRGRCVLVGDPCQLPATVMSQAAQSLRYERSLFERLQKCRFPVILLDTQYRMHPAIRCFPSNHFYQSKLLDSPSVQSRVLPSYTAEIETGPCVFWDVRADETRRGMSWCNIAETQVVIALLRSLFAKYPSVDFAGKIGVLTPYSSQLQELRRQYQRSLTKDQQAWVESNTVDAFQGREKDIVIFTCVRAGARRGIGFVADTRRMNVALTRAKQAIWVVGNAEVLGRNSDWRSYIRCGRQCSLKLALRRNSRILLLS